MNTSDPEEEDGFVRRSLLSQLNWHNALDGKPADSVEEYPLFSDAWITGEVTDGLGPYSFLNTVPLRVEPGLVNTSIILRASIHLEPYRPGPMSETDESLFHGGGLADEIAAMTSLCLGARISAGGATRRF